MRVYNMPALLWLSVRHLCLSVWLRIVVGRRAWTVCGNGMRCGGMHGGWRSGSGRNRRPQCNQSPRQQLIPSVGAWTCCVRVGL
ncbi:hypothetical protein LX32DRAFT_431708 [Colletotrichum zoysiae]|uniref:Secreted protein n=1 Tax=Colletotrichum zoysiae TaxID=1216348 RepID=A0AAD9M3J1_9PEZI|nr:hypothetical protein LX32DRAFT_431708 [Colletotrichum zoysiae]